MTVPGSCLHRIRASLHIIAQGFGCTRDFLKERNNSAYCRLKKIPCGCKQQARARHPGEKCGLAVCCGLLLICTSLPGGASPGFASRDLNPILQSIYLPGYAPQWSEDEWQLSHTLYVTNTSQRQTAGDETLLIDVENYRYEFSLSHRINDWVIQGSLPLISNQGGFLDSAIENYHDALGLPQGNRPSFARDQIEIEYSQDGMIAYQQTVSSSGLGDISIAFGYHPLENNTAYFLGIEFATGSQADFTGNEAIDIALWMIHSQAISLKANWYGLVGATFPGSNGLLKDLLVEQIWIGQIGVNYQFTDTTTGIVQLDMHSETIKNSALKAFGNSVQAQLGFHFNELIGRHSLDVFFSEDILVGSAPDISFGLRLSRGF